MYFACALLAALCGSSKHEVSDREVVVERRREEVVVENREKVVVEKRRHGTRVIVEKMMYFHYRKW